MLSQLEMSIVLTAKATIEMDAFMTQEQILMLPNRRSAVLKLIFSNMTKLSLKL